MSKTSLNFRPKVMLVITIFAVISVGAVCLIFSYFEALFKISDMDHIILDNEDSYTLYVDNSKYEYHADTLLFKDTPTPGKLFLKSGKTYDIKYVDYYGFFAVVINDQFGYYTIYDRS